ncbi:MAG: hypothetical protein HQL27_07745 [Candidatus Omnitrophica bacterium]|nr:hypothetical protein [Candidatus Omnitrophota bacterium]
MFYSLSLWHSTKKSPSFIVYIPESINKNAKNPWILGLSPAGNGRDLIPAWKSACDKFGWILVASNDFRNGIAMSKLEPFLLKTIKIAVKSYPVDPNNLYLSGFSGGGMGSHMMIDAYPNLIKGIIVNTCSMQGWANVNTYPRNKIAVFIASPTDFRYEKMKKDKKLLDDCGWKTKWIEFTGGHRWAPPEKYIQAVEWIKEIGKLDEI